MSPKKRFLKAKKLSGSESDIEGKLNEFFGEKDESVIESWSYRIDSQDTHHVLIVYTEG